MQIHISKAGARLFSMVPCNWMRSSGYKLKHKKFHLNIRKNFFTLRAAEHWNRLQGIHEVCLSGDWTQLDAFLSNLLQVTLPWQGAWTRWSSEISSNPKNSVILWWLLLRLGISCPFRWYLCPHCCENSYLRKNNYSILAAVSKFNYTVGFYGLSLPSGQSWNTDLQLHCTLVLGSDLIDDLNLFFTQFSFVYSWEQGFTHLILIKILIKKILIGQCRCISEYSIKECVCD